MQKAQIEYPVPRPGPEAARLPLPFHLRRGRRDAEGLGVVAVGFGKVVVVGLLQIKRVGQLVRGRTRSCNQMHNPASTHQPASQHHRNK